MPEKTETSLSSFMKKKISEKSSKNIATKNSGQSTISGIKNQKGKSTGKEGEGQDNEMTEEEQIEEAKKVSKGKAANRDESAMIKKMVIQSIVKYTLIVAGLVLFALGLMQVVPRFAEFLGGFLHQMFMGAFTR